MEEPRRVHNAAAFFMVTGGDEALRTRGLLGTAMIREQNGCVRRHPGDTMPLFRPSGEPCP